MAHPTNINNLLHIWQGRLQDSQFSTEYREAIGDCIYELQEVLNYSWQEEYINSLPPEEVEQYLHEQEADSYLSTIEAHENIA